MEKISTEYKMEALIIIAILLCFLCFIGIREALYRRRRRFYKVRGWCVDKVKRLSLRDVIFPKG